MERFKKKDKSWIIPSSIQLRPAIHFKRNSTFIRYYCNGLKKWLK